jgi:hypothetical protein
MNGPEPFQKIKINRRDFVRNGVIVACGCAIAPQILHAEKDDGSQSWTLANNLISRTVAFQPATGLYTQQRTLISSALTKSTLLPSSPSC